MITIITGTPGAGKTLYAVTKLLQKLLGATFQIKAADGAMVEKNRRIFTNVKGATFEHELIDGGGHWELVDKRKGEKPEWVFTGHSGGLRDWHLWAKPGDVICFDEVQEVWKPRANGAPVPPDIQALETHRHMGVDFILITQGINLTERNLSMLCGRHLHVRRVAAMPFAIVYEWDSASRTLLYSKSMAKEKWWYDRKGYKLYKSAELHTKSQRRLPAVLWLLLFGVVALAALSPWIYTRYGERFGWTKPITLAGAPVKSSTAAAAPSGTLPPAAAASAPSTTDKPPSFAGCARIRERCGCFDTQGQLVPKEPLFCEDATRVATGMGNVLANLRDDGAAHRELLARQAHAANDREVLSFMAQSERSRIAAKQ